MNSKIKPHEFQCVICKKPVAKLVPVGTDSPNSWFYDIKHYPNWNPPVNGKIVCKDCE